MAARSTKPAAPRKPRTKKKGADPALAASVAESDAFLAQQKKDAAAGGLKPIGEALKPLAEGQRAETAPRPSAETSADKLAAGQRPPAAPVEPTFKDGKLNVIPGKNVDMVGHFKTTTGDDVRAIARAYKDLKTARQTASGNISDLLTKAEENKHLNKRAFNLALKFDALANGELAKVWPIFLKYCDDFKVGERSTEQADMFAKAVEKDRQTDIEDEAAAAAKGLAPAKGKPTMTIVPKEPPAPEPTAESVFKPLH